LLSLLEFFGEGNSDRLVLSDSLAEAVQLWA
jgi:hypothetical protein